MEETRKENYPGHRKQIFKKSLYPPLTNASLTQSLFPKKKNSLQLLHDDCPKNGNVKQFCQTLGTNMVGEWIRPSSKRASRKQSNRPETSKGDRIFYKDKYFHNDPLKTLLPSKSMHNCKKEKTLNQLISIMASLVKCENSHIKNHIRFN